MAKKYQYCVAENWGKGFITAFDAANISFQGFGGNIWRVPAYNKEANLWINKVLGVPKTVAEAQAILDAEVSTSQTNWDNNNVEGETSEEKIQRLGERPVGITLEE